jgi:Icc-related predicted phosphoesterase
VIRIAAVGDLHAGSDTADVLRDQLGEVSQKADVLLIAGDLTKSGRPQEARVLARELGHVSVPVVAVLGNHDHHADRPEEIASLLRDVGVAVLEGQSIAVAVDDARRFRHHRNSSSITRIARGRERMKSRPPMSSTAA